MSSQDTKDVFGKLVSLDDYRQMFSPEECEKRFNGKFIDFVWVDLRQKDEDDLEFTNKAVREEQNDGDPIEEMQYSFRQDGWITTDFPPVVDNEFTFADGRTRGVAGMREHLPFMPAVMMEPFDDTTRGDYTNGLKLNYHPPRRRVKQGDFVVAGTELIRIGELPRDRTAIKEWLYKDCEIEKIFPNNAGGSISKIENWIWERTEKGGNPIVRRLDRSDWEKWLENCPDMKDVSGNTINPTIQLSGDPKFVFYDALSGANEARLVRDILENGSRGEHTYFALYTKRECAREIILAETKEFIASVEARLTEVRQYMQYTTQVPGLDLSSLPSRKLHHFLGLFPILFDGNGHEQAYKHKRLLRLDQF